MERAKRAGREIWAKRVQRWIDSGLTAQEFSAEVGVNLHTLRQWKHKLEGPVDGERRSLTPKTKRSFVEIAPVVLRADGAAESFELVLWSGMRVRVPPRFDAPSLKALIAALEGR
jgi:hypothetical protein